MVAIRAEPQVCTRAFRLILARHVPEDAGGGAQRENAGNGASPGRWEKRLRGRPCSI